MNNGLVIDIRKKNLPAPSVADWVVFFLLGGLFANHNYRLVVGFSILSHLDNNAHKLVHDNQ